ncbi:MAG: tRNA dihydrouridine synthase DusB [Zavarzinella sp.]
MSIQISEQLSPTLPEVWHQSFSIGSVGLKSRFCLAPLAGYTNVAFRTAIRGAGGVGLCTTDLVNARAVVEQIRKTLELLATNDDDKPLSVQLFGSKPDEMAQAAKWVQDYGADLIDINMGCPVRKVVKTGGGSAMMCDTSGSTVEMIKRIVDAVSIPVTVKMRLGWDATQITAPEFAHQFEQVGVQAITIHGRTREQGFSGTVDLEGIRQVVQAVDRIPVIGNGDVRTIEDAQRMIEVTGCQAIAIGRGALANPWIFRQLDNWVRTGDPGPRGSYEERIHFMMDHLYRLVAWRGEYGACLQFRKIATWYAKALRTGKHIQQLLVMLSSVGQLEAIAKQLLQQGPPEGWVEWDAGDANIPVPKGPIAHW